MKQKKKKKLFTIKLKRQVIKEETVMVEATDYEDAEKIGRRKARCFEDRRGERARWFSVDLSDWFVGEIEEVEI